MPLSRKRISLPPSTTISNREAIIFNTKLLPWLKGLFKDEKGQNIVEFALITPILLMIFMGVFDFGWLLHKQIQLDQGTRAGARRAAIGADNAEVINVIQDTCAFTVTEEMITIEVRDQNGTSVGDPADRSEDNYFYVAVDIPDIQFITPLKALVDVIGDVSLHSESTFIIE